jgi:hypothetical protein
MTMTRRLARVLGVASQPRARTLDGFLDRLLQTFENCRPGLADDTVARGPMAVSGFYLEIYEKESGRLRQAMDREHAHLPAAVREDLHQRVDERIRQVLIPAYARLAAPLTRRERNDFYLLRGELHGFERMAWAVGGMVIGLFVIWAPFIPIWEKEWVLPFAAAGLFLPEIRRYYALKRYEGELNRLVGRLDDEIWRMDLAYWTEEAAAEPRRAIREGER